MKLYHIALTFVFLLACTGQNPENGQATTVKDTVEDRFMWENASVYFLLIDRFKNGDTSNDFAFNRKKDGAILRNFEGGDIKGITQKIEDGYFNDLGIDAIWITPPIEQVHGHTDEGTGKTYGYHGYWARDWTNIDPNFGTWEDLREMIDEAHNKGIRILLDVVINHTGPVTETDSQWPDTWVRTSPKCAFEDFETTVSCTLVENLPDIRTESDEAVDLPPFLVEKWKKEGRYEEEVLELEAFFKRTGFPRSPRHYIIKWLTDFIRKFGIDGYRVDTAKHTEATVWDELYKEAQAAFTEWKSKNPDAVLDDEEFFMVGEVYNYSIGHGKYFQMGKGDSINFFDHSFKSLINFDLKGSGEEDLEKLFSRYSDILNKGPLKGYSVMNYISSHDDSAPFDPERTRSMQAATRQLLAPGSVQIYYGDELARPLKVKGANGDANLRSFMNWEDLNDQESQTSEVLEHYRKLCKFRQSHPAIGAGVHSSLSEEPYIFKRELVTDKFTDKVVVVLGKTDDAVDVSGIFEDGTDVQDYYSGRRARVKEGKIKLTDSGNILLLGKP